MKLIAEAQLSTRFHPTGRTRHFSDGELLPAPYRLRVSAPDEGGYYLYYLDENGEEMTDTFFDTLPQLFEQAEFEFGIRPCDWQFMDGR